MRNDNDNKNNATQTKIKSYFNKIMDTIKQHNIDSNEFLIKTLNEADKQMILSKIDEFNQVNLFKEQLNKMQDNINLVINNQIHIQESLIHLATNVEEMMHHLEECGIIPNNELSSADNNIPDEDNDDEEEQDEHMYFIDVNKESDVAENNKYKKDDVLGKYNKFEFASNNKNNNKKIDIN